MRLLLGCARLRACTAAPALALLSYLATGSVVAQQAPPVRTVDEQERLDPEYGLAPGEIVVFRTTPTDTIEGAESMRFVLRDVVIEGGATAFSTEELKQRFAAFIGKEVSVADLAAVARCIEGRYDGDRGGAREEGCAEDGLRTRGYFTSRVVIPAQIITDGVFRLVIVEGYIRDARVTPVAEDESVGPVEDAIAALLTRVIAEKPVRDKTLERQLLLVNDLPGVTARGALEAAQGPDTLGASDLSVTASRDPLDIFLVVDNRGSEFTGPWAGFVGFATNSFTRYAERLEGIVYTSLDFDEQLVGQLNYSQLAPFPWAAQNGLRIGASLSNARTRPGSTLDPLEFESRTLFASIHAIYPFIRSQALTLEGRLAGNWTDSDIDARDTRISRDRIRTIDVALTARTADDIAAGAVGGRRDNATTATLQVRTGVDALGASSAEDTRTSRLGAGGGFTIFSGDVSRRQRLPVIVPGAPAGEGGLPLYVFGRIAGQWTKGSVYSVEEFQLGGARFGRGYDPAALSGDRAFGATGELQLDVVGALRSIAAPRTIAEVGQALGRARDDRGRLFTAAQVYAFVDFGMTWNDEGGAFDDALLFSTGLGLRLRIADHFGVDVEAAKPLSCESCLTADNAMAAFVRLVIY